MPHCHCDLCYLARLTSDYSAITPSLSRVCQVMSCIVGFWLVATNGFSLFVTLGLIATLGGYLLAALVYGRLLPVLLTYVQYAVSIPLWVNVFAIFSVTNLVSTS